MKSHHQLKALNELAHVSNYLYYDEIQHKLISADAVNAFSSKFTMMRPSVKKMQNSAYKIMRHYTGLLLTNDTYTHVQSFYQLPNYELIIEAMRKGVSRNAVDKANKTLYVCYQRYHSLNQVLHPAIAAFLDLYEGLERFSQGISSNFSSHNAILNILTKQTKTRTQQESPLYNLVNLFDQAVNAVVRSLYYPRDMFIQSISSDCYAVSTAILSLQDSDYMTSSFTTCSAELFRIRTQYENIVGCLKNDQMQRENLIQLLQMKTKIKEMESLITQPNNPFEKQYQETLSLAYLKITKSMGMFNSISYLEKNDMRKLLGQFFGVKNHEKTSICDIITSAEQRINTQGKSSKQNRLYHKVVVINHLKDFIDGQIDDKEFYHLMKSQVELNRPRFSIFRINWIARLFYKPSIAARFADTEHLARFVKKISNSYAFIHETKYETTSAFKSSYTLLEEQLAANKQGQVADRENIGAVKDQDKNKQMQRRERYVITKLKSLLFKTRTNLDLQQYRAHTRNNLKLEHYKKCL